jgi:hypothetical protein
MLDPIFGAIRVVFIRVKGKIDTIWISTWIEILRLTLHESIMFVETFMQKIDDKIS